MLIRVLLRGAVATVHPHVHLDVGLALHYVGPDRAAAVLAEAMELTPFGKLLYSADAYAVPEFYHPGALTFRRAPGRLLRDRVDGGDGRPGTPCGSRAWSGRATPPGSTRWTTTGRETRPRPGA